MSGVISNTIVTDGLILYYDGANPQCYISGNTVCNDLSLTQSSGTLTNGVTYDTDNNGSWVFDGLDDYIEIGNNVAFDLERTDSFSMSGWIKLGSYSPPIEPIIAKWDVAINRGYQFGVESTGKIRFLLSSSWPVSPSILYVRTTTDTIPLNTWVHIAITYGGTSDISGCNIYIDGVPKPISLISNPSSILTSTTINTENLLIGELAGYLFEGNIASARMWDRELTQEEITQNYNAMKSRFNL